MNGKCFEAGAIQAFLDGETTPEVSLRISDHVAACDGCARLMAEAEEENSIVFSTLERELNTLVPTQRLWSRINETIEVEKGRTPVWQKFLAAVSASFANPSIAAMAGVLLLLGVFGIMTLKNERDLTFVGTPPFTPPGPTKIAEPGPAGPSTTEAAPPSGNATTQFAQSNLPPKEIQSLVQRANARSSQREIRPQYAVANAAPASDKFLPGEESYVRTISDLRQNVDSQKDVVLSPSTRVSYERDMAVVNDSIKRMREVVKKNPRNQAARQVLYSSYQDKIDLLNSVAQREELMASR